MGIDNRVTVITGATGTAGRTVAQRFAELGARLALFSTNAERLDTLARDLDLPPERLLTRALDLRKQKAAKLAEEMVLGKFGRADVLLHLVGGWTGGLPVVRVPPEELQNMLDQHLWSTFHVVQAFSPHLVAQGWGRIVVITSPHAAVPSGNDLSYAVAKAAQEALLLTLAREVNNTGVTVNLLRVQTIDAEHARERNPSPANAAWTTPEEITASIVYLCSDEARAVNGARIPLYGASRPPA